MDGAFFLVLVVAIRTLTLPAVACLLGTLLVGSVAPPESEQSTDGLLIDGLFETLGPLGAEVQGISGDAALTGATSFIDGESTTPDDGEWVPLGGEPTPEWLTPEILQKVHEASMQGMGYDITSGLGVVPNTPAVLIRPGTMMLSPDVCTMAFVYDTISQPGLFIGTAGHCIPNVGDRVVVLAAPTLLLEMGTAVITTSGGAIGYDYALVAIDDVFEPFVSASMAGLGGPGCSTQYNGNPGAQVKMWGQSVLGQALSVVGTPVTGTFTSYTGPRWDAAMGGRGITGGDSGAALIESVDTNSLVSRHT